MLHADLKVLGGRHEGKIISLTTKKFLIGRGDDCHMRPNNELVSRHHCVFNLDDFSVRLRDLGSTNGTFVNDEQIRGQVELKTGDRVRIGKLELMVTIRQGAPVAAAVPEEPEEYTNLSGETIPDPESVDEVESAAEAGMETMHDTGILAEADTTFYPPNQAPPPLQYGQGAMPPGYAYPPPGYMPQQFMYPYPPPQPGYPQYPMMPPAGYPQFPQMGYPPQMPTGPYAAPAPEQPPAQEAQAESAKKSPKQIDVKLPDPSETGAIEAPPPSQKAGSPEDRSKNPSAMAVDIIQQYTRRRPTGG